LRLQVNECGKHSICLSWPGRELLETRSSLLKKGK